MQSCLRTHLPLRALCAILALGATLPTPAEADATEPPDVATERTEGDGSGIPESPKSPESAGSPDAHGSPDAPKSPDASEIYDRVGERLRALDKALFEGLAPDADDPQAMYLATGIADERMTRWLAAARVVADDLIAASQLPYQRTIDPQDGFTLGPAHLAPLRTTTRSLAILVRDAALSGDRDRLAELLRVQITLAIRTAADGTLPSSISAINAIQEHMRTVDGLLDCGAIDAVSARRLLEIRAPLDMVRDFGTVAATRAELEALQAELDRILLTPLEERPAAVAGLRITVPVRLDDNAVLAARGGALAYMTDVAAALDEQDFAVGRQRLVIAEQRLRDGVFGDLLKVLAPQVLPTADLLARSRSELETQRRVLDLLASGQAKPAMHADAGWYYRQASRAAIHLPLAAQSAIEAIRMSGDLPSTATVSDARRAINACRSSVIEPIMLASQSSRCSLPHHPAGAAGGGLVRACADGLNGAVRVVLADAFGAGGRPVGSPTRAEATIACLRVAARFAALGSYSHSLVAHQVLRDLKHPLKQLEARGELTPAVRSELAAILKEMGGETGGGDPLGYEVAVQAERVWLASRSFPSGSSAVVAFDPAHLERLTPNQIGFLLAMFTAARQVPFDAPRGSPLDGALVDIRPWFDLAAFKRAYSQFETVRARAQRDALVRQGDAHAVVDALAAENDSAIAWLDVTTPVDIEARMRDAKTDFDAVVQIVSSPARGARQQVSSVRTP